MKVDIPEFPFVHEILTDENGKDAYTVTSVIGSHEFVLRKIISAEIW